MAPYTRAFPLRVSLQYLCSLDLRNLRGWLARLWRDVASILIKRPNSHCWGLSWMLTLPTTYGMGNLFLVSWVISSTCEKNMEHPTFAWQYRNSSWGEGPWRPHLMHGYPAYCTS